MRQAQCAPDSLLRALRAGLHQRVRRFQLQSNRGQSLRQRIVYLPRQAVSLLDGSQARSRARLLRR